MAQAIAENGHLRLDGRAVTRSSTQVRVGSVLTFALHGQVRAIRVIALPARRGPAIEAATCIIELTSTHCPGDDGARSVDASAGAT